MQTFALFGAKSFGFMVCRHEQGGGLVQCGHFSDKGVIFHDFVHTFFYGRPQKQKTLLCEFQFNAKTGYH